MIGAPLARYTGLEIGAAETELIATGLSMIGGLVAGYLAYRAGTASKPLGE